MSLERDIGRILSEKGLTVAAAESCTAGLVSYRLTSVSGSSAYFVGGIVAYANRVKIRELRVDAGVLARRGAVCAEVARQMARGAMERLGADIGLGVTGIAGPGGGTSAKPVGLVYVAVADANGCRVQRHVFPGNRATVRNSSCRAVLAMLKKRITSS